jgi:hypothetical protein
MKFRDVPQSGSRGNTVASRNRSGPYHRERVAPAQPATDAQCAAWRNMTDLSRMWNLVEERQRIAWGGLAEELHTASNLGISGRLSGVQLFKKLNLVLATCRRPLLLDPPPLPEFGPNPVKGFEIPKAGRDIALILKVSPNLRWKARSPLEDFMVQGWAPQNAGTEKNSLYAFLGLLPPPADGECDITDLYMDKLLDWRQLKDKRYHIPLAGSKIFIRVVQQINGWENELWAFSACALAPMDEDWRTRELAALLKARSSARRRQ